MLFSTVGQGPVFLWMTAAGALIGLWYACTGALRRLLRAGFWLSLAADLAFGAGAAALFCAALVTANYGQVRLYAVLGALLGFSLFTAAARAPALRAARIIVKALRHLFRKVEQIRWINVIFR